MYHKKCTKCDEIKPISSFSVEKRVMDGFTTCCKKCKNEQELARKRTKTGLILRMYTIQKESSNRRGYSLPDYSKQDLVKWALSQDIFHETYDNWVNSGYRKELKPSFDRKNDYESYVFSNLQIVTLEQNYKKAQSDRKNGINNKHSKSVVGKHLITKDILEFPSQNIAARFLGIKSARVSECCLRKRESAGGYIWEFKN